MDVRCNRCSTEYEFDDALISERGTTVKCTNCGYQFKVYPTGAAGGAPERWVVRTQSGKELVYTSLRDLQRGIADRQVEPDDLLSRGNQPARPLRTIAELEPFFEMSLGKIATERGSTPRTLHGVAPPANSVGGTFRESPPRAGPSPTAHTLISAPPPAAPPQPAPVRAAPVVRTHDPRPVNFGATLPAAEAPPDVPRPAAPPAAVEVVTTAASRTPPAPEAFPKTEAAPTAASPGESPPLSHTLPLSQAAPRFAPPPASRPSHDRLQPEPMPAAPASGPARESLRSYDELTADDDEPESSASRARSRWIAAVVLAGIVGLVAVTVGRRYLTRISAKAPDKAELASSDKRVTQFLNEGNRLLAEGDLEGASEQFVKASALAEKDPAVLAALARLETLRADVFWLKLRLLDPASTEIVQATHRELGRRVGKARSAVDQAFALAPEDPVVLRARIDAMRLSGESDKAREWVGPISNNQSQPENAYVLAALDLAEPNPVWSSVIDRLRAAAAGEREPGRARAALIYALARADRLTEAETELGKIEARPRPHALLDELRTFLQRYESARDGGTSGDAVATVDPGKLPALDTSPEPESPAKRAAPAAAADKPGDFRTKLSQAASAVRSGQLDEAERLFNAVLAEQPGNVEAISGLGDVARRRGDSATAARMYDRVLQQNPSYLPALLASADSKWDSGDRKGAVALYKRVVDQAGPGSEYGSRAAARIAQAEPAQASAPAAAETEAAPAPAPEPAAPAAEPPAAEAP